MTILEQIEQLRFELVKKVAELTGLPIDDFEVTINFHDQDVDSPLVTEAQELDWHPDDHKGSSWYTSEKPTGGSTIVFLKDEEE